MKVYGNILFSFASCEPFKVFPNQTCGIFYVLLQFLTQFTGYHYSWNDERWLNDWVWNTRKYEKNTNLPSERYELADMTFTCEWARTKSTFRNLSAIRRVEKLFSTHSVYLLKSQSENKELSRNVWIQINQLIASRPKNF